MSLKKNLLPFFYFPYRFLNVSKKIINSKNHKTRLRILLFHDIPKSDHINFINKIEYLSKYWNFITVQEFEDFLNKKIILNGDNLLITFDDGFYSNRTIVEEILNPMGIKALFFIVSELAKITNQKLQMDFIQNNIFPNWRKTNKPLDKIKIKSLTYKDLNYLIKSGHSIGSHTSTHANLSQLVGNKDLIYEIIDSADQIEKQLGIIVKHFAFGFGHISFFSKLALKVAKSRFPFIHTGMRGDNAKSMIPWAIRRDHIEINDSFYKIGSYLEGAADYRYKKDFDTYETWDK